MPCRLSREEVLTIQVLSQKQVPKRAIARQLGVSEGTVRYHLRRQDESAEDGRRGKPFKAVRWAEPIEAWCQAHEPSSRPINVRDLHDHLVAEHGYDGSYKSVLRYVRRRYGRPAKRTYRRVETPPGAQTQTDWGTHTDLDLGEGAEILQAFVMGLSHSRMPAIIWSHRQDQVSWLRCHNEAYRRLGGVAAVNRIDNVKTALQSGAGAWGVIHPVYRSYSRTMGFHVDACAPREPQAKGKSEAKVKLSRRLLPSPRRRYDGLEELQAETDARIERYAKKTSCPATGMTIWDSWETEREWLRDLPPTLPEPFDVSVRRPVHADCTAHFEGRQYTVPFRYVGRSVEIRGCAESVQIFHEHELVREYPRHTAEKILIDPSCYEGESTAQALAPPPLGKMGRKLQEIYETPVEQRPLDLYAALAEVAR